MLVDENCFITGWRSGVVQNNYFMLTTSVRNTVELVASWSLLFLMYRMDGLVSRIQNMIASAHDTLQYITQKLRRGSPAQKQNLIRSEL